MIRWLLTGLLSFAVLGSQTQAQEKKKDPPKQPDKTAANVQYGTHERQLIDFWKAKSDKPTPLVLYIHGGGWRGGDKNTLNGTIIQQYLHAGISVAAINYRYVQNGVELKIEPPVKAPLEDAARALQFIRSKADEWNIDKKKIGATGGSAGACSSLWLAFHDDMADPKSEDKVARESTRLYCAAVNGAQVTLDPKPLREWMPNYGYGAHAFGLASFQELYDKRENVLKWIKEYSPMEHVSKDDPPIYMEYPNPKNTPKVGEKQVDPTHSVVMGIKLAEKLKENNIEVILVYPEQKHEKYGNSHQYLLDRLKK